MRVESDRADRDWPGEKLREWRKANGRSMCEVAGHLNVSVATVSRWELGWVPDIHQAHKIVRLTRGAIRYRDIYRSLAVEYV